jgi:hypothetical protein
LRHFFHHGIGVAFIIGMGLRWRYLSVLTVLSLCIGGTDAIARAPLSCAQVVSGSEGLIYDRLSLAMNHQNKLRRHKELPLLQAPFVKTGLEDNAGYRAEIVGAFPEEAILGNFLIRGDALIRASYGDIHSLNYVYIFEGNQLAQTKSYAVWALEGHASPSIHLYRKMSAQELELWHNGKLESLGSEWGYGEKVVHFATDAGETTSPLPDSAPLIEIGVPKKLLLTWAQEKRIWAGVLNPETLATEFIIPASLLPFLPHYSLVKK